MTTPNPQELEAGIAGMITDGVPKRVRGPQGDAIVVPEATYEGLLKDAHAWRRLRNQTSDAPSAHELAILAFGNRGE